jgi:hypothetical protein
MLICTTRDREYGARLDLLKIAVLPIGVAQRPLACVIVDLLDLPVSGPLAIFKDFGRFQVHSAPIYRRVPVTTMSTCRLPH